MSFPHVIDSLRSRLQCVVYINGSDVNTSIAISQAKLVADRRIAKFVVYAGLVDVTLPQLTAWRHSGPNTR